MLNNRIISIGGTIPVFFLAAALLAGPPLAEGQATPGPAQPGFGPAGTGAASPGGPAAAEAPQEPPTEAERLIDVAIKQLAALNSVSADMIQNVEMLNQKFALKGRYLRAPSTRIYLKLTVTGLPDSSGTILQVCDGETLWDYQQVLDSQFYRKLSVKPILEKLKAPELDPKLREQVMAQMGLAGPEALLMGLRRSIKFEQKEEGELDGKAVWILRGTWRNRNGLIGPDQRPVPPTGQLPAYVPSLATLYLGKSDGWPYKLVLVGKMPTILLSALRKGSDGRLVPSTSAKDKVSASRIELTYSDVKLNPPLRVEEFAFQAPPNAQPEDGTEMILKGLEQAIQLQAAQKKAEAARLEGPTLDQPIEIPKPPTEPAPR